MHRMIAGPLDSRNDGADTATLQTRQRSIA